MLGTDRRFLHLMGLRPTGDLGPLTIYTSQRGKMVAFLRAPPTKPPTERQRHIRNQFRQAAWLWKSETAERRAQWEELSKRNYLKITGYNLYVWYHMKHDDAIIRTLNPSWGPPY